MTRDWYMKTTLAVMKTLRFETTGEIVTGMTSIPAGAAVTVISKGNGLTISGPKCKCCGVSVFARKVHPRDLRVVA